MMNKLQRIKIYSELTRELPDYQMAYVDEVLDHFKECKERLEKADETIRQMSDTITDMATRIAELEAAELDYQNELKVKDRHFDNMAKYLDELRAARLLIDDTTSVSDAILLYQERIQQLEAHVKQIGGRLADATAENLAWQRSADLLVN